MGLSFEFILLGPEMIGWNTILALLCVAQAEPAQPIPSDQPQLVVADAIWIASSRQSRKLVENHVVSTTYNALCEATRQAASEWGNRHVLRTTYSQLCDATKEHGVRHHRTDNVITPLVYVQRDFFGVEHLAAYGQARFYVWLPGARDLHFMTRECWMPGW